MLIVHRAFSAFILSLALILLCTSCQGDESGGKARTCLWKVESEGNIVNLLGSIHVPTQEDHPLPGSMEDAFDDADVLVFELDIDSAETDEAQDMVLLKATGDDANTLRSMLSEDAYDLTCQEAAELGIDIDRYGYFEPWFIALYVHQLKSEQLGFESEYGVDFHFYDKAKDVRKDIHALETVEYQIDILDQLSEADREMLLLEMFAELEVYEAQHQAIVDSWRDGDMDALEGMVIASFEGYPDMYDTLITGRNDNWLPQIEDFLAEEDNYMVVVGAGHLIGPDGIVALLEAKGYSVEQL
jgi:uncharacterized protein YbaP (TraB family)